MENKELIIRAREAMKNAYVPYSKFRVGAVIIAEDGKIFDGCNIENASFGGTNCAERTALFKGISEGYRRFNKVVVISDSANYTYPCGICRQVLAEFNKDMEVVVVNNKMEYRVHKLSDLLPYSFDNNDLERR